MVSIENYHRFKRVCDVVLASLGIVLLLPLFLIIMVLVKMDSKGPVFFTQRRVTKGRNFFTMYKFRSMVENARELQLKGVQIEKLITKHGWFLRDVHFDEFPQLWNILKGEMTFVGPRPLMLHHFATFKDKDVFKRTEVKAGLTSLERLVFLMPWEKEKILSKLPNATFLLKETGRIPFDTYYVDNESFYVDTVIFLNTIKLVLKKLIWPKYRVREIQY